MMLERRKQLEVINNDVAVLEALFGNKDGDDCVFPGKYMPDGKEFRISLKGVKRMTNELRERMVQLVRSQYDARENEQNAEKAGNEAAPTADTGGTDSSTSGRGASAPPAKADAQSNEESLEAILCARETRYTEELERLDYELGQVVDDRNKVISQLQEVKQCIQALQSVSQTISKQSSDTTESPEPHDGSTSAGPKGSQKRRTSKSKRNSTSE